MFGYSLDQYKRFHAYAWRYLILFSVLYCFLYCTRLNLSNAGAVMMQGLGWSKSDFGILTGALFWTYGIGQFVNGRLSEIVGPGKFVVASVILSVAFAFKVLPNLGWRSAFLVSAAFPLVALVAYLVWARTSPTQIGLVEYVEDDPARAKIEEEMRELVAQRGKLYPYKYVLSNRQFLVWIAIAFITGLARYGLVTWVPLYFIDRFDISVTRGLMGSLSLPVGMGIGTLVVPWMTDKWCPNNRLPAVIASAIIGAISIGGFLLLDPTVGWQMMCVQVLLFVAGFCIYAINGTAWAYATDIGGRVFSATSSGVLNFSAYMGAAAQSFVYGFLLDKIGWISVFASLAVLCGLMAVMGVGGRKKSALD